jgi:rhodanese-related sulfurtransferase
MISNSILKQTSLLVVCSFPIRGSQGYGTLSLLLVRLTWKCPDFAQLGVSILDTRDIGRLPFQAALRTYNFAFDKSPKTRRHIEYGLLSGNAQHLPLGEMLSSLEELLDRDRNLVLVGHGLGSDMSVLTSLEFDIKKSIAGIFDK